MQSIRFQVAEGQWESRMRKAVAGLSETALGASPLGSYSSFLDCCSSLVLTPAISKAAVAVEAL